MVTPMQSLSSSSAPPAVLPAPVRLSLAGVPAGARATVYRELCGRSLMCTDIEPLENEGFEIDYTLHTLPGLVVMSGTGYGSENRRTRQMLAAAATDEIGLVINLTGEHRVIYRGQDSVLGDGDAMMVSFEEVCS